MTSLAVIDTHALLWAVTGQKKRLGRHALKLLERVDAGHAALYIPVMVLAELGEAEQRGAIRLDGGFDEWVGRLLDSGRYHPVALTVAIVGRAQRLYTIPERGDRLIAATAAELDLPLVTRDPAIAAAADVEVVW